MLEGRLRLAALFLFLRSEAPAHVVVRATNDAIITDPLAVEWANFPLQEAIEATKAHRYELAPRPRMTG